MECRVCKAVDPECGFYRKERQCKECGKAAARRRYTERYANDAEYRAREKIRGALNRRKRYIKQHYGLTIEEYEAFLASTDGECQICKRVAKLVLDHDHATGLPRGALCQGCNLLLGHANEDTEVLQEAIRYLLHNRNIDAVQPAD